MDQEIPETIPSSPPRLSVDYTKLTRKEPIGAGGNADVSKAILEASEGDVPVAIKEPRIGGTLHTDAVKRLLEEADTWDKLDDHDHIVDVIDYGSEPLPWIAMEYMDGGHLGERRGEMATPQALWTAIAITKGVRHAHRQGVAHLDLKPENILFRTVEDAWNVPKIADWGLSKHLLEHSQSIEGISPQYAAPEQFDEEYGPTDDITDIYQLGAVLYELFTGQPPFEGEPARAMHKVLNEEPSPPTEQADLHGALDEILLKALAKNKADRYRTVEYLEDALLDCFDNLPTQSSTDQAEETMTEYLEANGVASDAQVQIDEEIWSASERIQKLVRAYEADELASLPERNVEETLEAKIVETLDQARDIVFDILAHNSEDEPNDKPRLETLLTHPKMDEQPIDKYVDTLDK